MISHFLGQKCPHFFQNLLLLWTQLSAPLLHKYPFSNISSFPFSPRFLPPVQFSISHTEPVHLSMFFSQEDVQLDRPVFETGFTPSEIQQLLSLFESPTTPNSEPVDSPNSGSEESNSNSNSNPTRAVNSVDERKRKRMTSNRESARRSRWRKKRHIENLSVQQNRLETQNREMKNLLGSVLEHCGVLWRDNNRLTTEHFSLQHRLSNLSHVLVAMQTQNPLL